MDWLIKAIDEGRLVQKEYERAHQRIHESHTAGGDAMASTIERIKGLTNPHKLVGTHYAAKDHGMGDAAALASSQLKRMHKRTVDSFPAPSRKVKPVDVGSSAGKKLPKAPLPQKGQGREDYVKTVFHHYRNMGRPHNQAWAIAHSMADRHHVQKSVEEVMARYDLVSPRPLRPAQQDRTLFPMREEQARFAAREERVAPPTRKGMQSGALPGTRAPRAPLPALVLNKALAVSDITFRPPAPHVPEKVHAQRMTVHHGDMIKEHHAAVEKHEGQVRGAKPAMKPRVMRAVQLHKDAVAAHHAARGAVGTSRYEEARDKANHASDLANSSSLHLEGLGRARKAMDDLMSTVSKAFVMVMPARTSHPSLQPQPARGVSYPTQVVALDWLARASRNE